MVISEVESIVFERLVTRNVAKKVGVKDFDFKSYSELLNEVQAKNGVAYQKLSSFLEAYKKWDDFHKEIRKAGKEGQLSKEETEKLTFLSSQKDLKRRELVEYMSGISK